MAKKIETCKRCGDLMKGDWCKPCSAEFGVLIERHLAQVRDERQALRWAMRERMCSSRAQGGWSWDK